MVQCGRFQWFGSLWIWCGVSSDPNYILYLNVRPTAVCRKNATSWSLPNFFNQRRRWQVKQISTHLVTDGQKDRPHRRQHNVVGQAQRSASHSRCCRPCSSSTDRPAAHHSDCTWNKPHARAALYRALPLPQPSLPPLSHHRTYDTPDSHDTTYHLNIITPHDERLLYVNILGLCLVHLQQKARWSLACRENM